MISALKECSPPLHLFSSDLAFDRKGSAPAQQWILSWLDVRKSGSTGWHKMVFIRSLLKHTYQTLRFQIKSQDSSDALLLASHKLKLSVD